MPRHRRPPVAKRRELSANAMVAAHRRCVLRRRWRRRRQARRVLGRAGRARIARHLGGVLRGGAHGGVVVGRLVAAAAVLVAWVVGGRIWMVDAHRRRR